MAIAALARTRDKVRAREKLGQCAGRLAPADLARFDRAMLVFLGLANRT